MTQPDFNSEALTDSETFLRPEGRPDHEDGGGSSTALLGLGASVGKLAVIIAIVYYAQKLLGWLEKRFRKVKLIKPKKVLRILLWPVSDRACWWHGEDTGHSQTRYISTLLAR